MLSIGRNKFAIVRNQFNSVIIMITVHRRVYVIDDDDDDAYDHMDLLLYFSKHHFSDRRRSADSGHIRVVTASWPYHRI